MFDTNEILARLQNGEDAQDIANEMADLLNAANDLYKEKQEADRRAAEHREVQKRDRMETLIAEFAIWLEDFYGVPQSNWEDVTADSVIDLVDSVVEYMNTVKELTNTLKAVKGAPAPKTVFKSNTPPKSADETINSFLKQMGW